LIHRFEPQQIAPTERKRLHAVSHSLAPTSHLIVLIRRDRVA
jgi:hypothetical protein